MSILVQALLRCKSIPALAGRLNIGKDHLYKLIRGVRTLDDMAFGTVYKLCIELGVDITLVVKEQHAKNDG
jgi:hypothetical protein